MRDKNNLSHPETPVFMRVSKDYVRDERFFLKPARVAVVGVVFLAEVAICDSPCGLFLCYFEIGLQGF